MLGLRFSLMPAVSQMVTLDFYLFHGAYRRDFTHSHYQVPAIYRRAFLPPLSDASGRGRADADAPPRRLYFTAWMAFAFSHAPTPDISAFEMGCV